MALYIMTLSRTVFNMLIFSIVIDITIITIITFSTMKLSMMQLSTMAFSIKALSITTPIIIKTHTIMNDIQNMSISEITLSTTSRSK